MYLWLIHVVVWQKPTQNCKAIILQLKINFKEILDIEFYQISLGALIDMTVVYFFIFILLLKLLINVFT